MNKNERKNNSKKNFSKIIIIITVTTLDKFINKEDEDENSEKKNRHVKSRTSLNHNFRILLL